MMELGPQNHNRDGLLRPNSVMGVYMDPLGNKEFIKLFNVYIFHPIFCFRLEATGLLGF